MIGIIITITIIIVIVIIIVIIITTDRETMWKVNVIRQKRSTPDNKSKRQEELGRSLSSERYIATIIFVTVVSLWTGWSVEPELIASICPRGIFQNGNLPARKESRGMMMIMVK